MKEQKGRISDEETKKLQAYILELMVNIDRVCREHHLRYYLCCAPQRLCSMG